MRLAKEYGGKTPPGGVLGIKPEVALLKLFADPDDRAEARENMEAVDHIRAVA
jgi:hypothetical protein